MHDALASLLASLESATESLGPEAAGSRALDLLSSAREATSKLAALVSQVPVTASGSGTTSVVDGAAPREAEAAAAPAAAGIATAAAAAAATAPRSDESVVFIVDDDDDSRRLIGRWLKSAKMTCVAHPSGASALEALAAQGSHVDAVVLDVTMPGMDGFEVASRIRADPTTASIPVIMVTAHATGEAAVTRGMAAGAVDYLAKPFSGPVLIAKVRAACERHRAERELRSRLHSAQELATTDALTGLSNRRAFDEALPGVVARGARNGTPVSVVVLDIDHFKRINDTYGHPGGDEILASFGRALRRVVREGDQAFRYGGEEFVLVLPKCGVEDAVRVVGRIQRDLREHAVVLPQGEVTIKFSAGVAAATPANAFRHADLVSRADAALYRAKAGGRDRIEIESPTEAGTGT